MHLPTHTSILPFVKNQRYFSRKQTFIEKEIKPRINTRIIIVIIIIIIIITVWCICLVLTLANLHTARVSRLVVFTIKESYKLSICLLFTATTKYVTVATRITGLTNSQRRIVRI